MRACSHDSGPSNERTYFLRLQVDFSRLMLKVGQRGGRTVAVKIVSKHEQQLERKYAQYVESDTHSSSQ